MGVAPDAVSDAPRSVEPLHNLIASAPTFVGDDQGEADGILEGRWLGGIEFKPRNCQEAATVNPCGVTNEIQSITVDATSGTWTVDYNGDVSGPLAFGISAYDLQVALEGLVGIELGDVVVVGGPGDAGGTAPYFITFTGLLEGVDVVALVVASIDLAGGGASVTQDQVQEAGDPIVKQPYTDPTEFVVVDPYTVEVPFECSSFGWQTTDYEERALDNLRLGKSKAIESEWWTGTKIPTNPSLVRSTPNDDAHILNPGGAAAPTPVSPGIALILFAQALANCGTGQRGMIHATPALVERWLNLTAVNSVSISDFLAEELGIRNEPGLIILTPGRGDIVVNGAGYPGTGPLGQPPPGPNEVWAYATGIVNVRTSDTILIPDNLDEALDRATNTITYRGEMEAMAYDDGCCRFAVLIDICGTV